MSVELIETTTPLASIARPAGRPRTPDRFLFASTTEDRVAVVAAELGAALAEAVGPTRSTHVVVQTARGDAVYRALAELVHRYGQSRDTVDDLAASYHRLADDAERRGLAPVFVLAQCGVLWEQSRRLVGLQ